MDEPTNHLDMHSVELLAEALNKYEGSFIAVSHDRFFISKTANKIWEIVDHKIKEFKGSYQEWVEWNERMARIANEKSKLGYEPKPEAPKQEAKPAPQPVKEPKHQSPVNKELQKELQKEKKRLDTLEGQLTKAKEEEAKFENALGDPANYSDKDKFVTIESDYKRAKTNRVALEKEYEDVFEKVMDLEGKV